MKLFRDCTWLYNQIVLKSSKLNEFKVENDDETIVYSDDNLSSESTTDNDDEEYYNNVRNDWEWLSLRYERRLNELLNVMKNNKNNTNQNINTNANLSSFLSFVPVIIQNYFINHINNVNDCVNSINSNDPVISVNLSESVENFDGIDKKIIEMMKDHIFEGDVPIMFLDISGFTKLTEKIESSGDSQSVANLGKFLNDFFDPIIKLIYYYNGDIIKFSGDAILSVFHSNSSESSNTEDVENCINCAKCCLELHNVLNNYPIFYNLQTTNIDSNNRKNSVRYTISINSQQGDQVNILNTGDFEGEDGGEIVEEQVININIHICCIYGNISVKLVGGIFERYEFIVIGQVLNELNVLTGLSKSSETILSNRLYEKIEKFADVQQIIHEDNVYYKLLSMNDLPSCSTYLRNLDVIKEIEGLTDRSSYSGSILDFKDTLSRSDSSHNLSFIRRYMTQIYNYSEFDNLSRNVKVLEEINKKGNNVIIKLLKYFIPRYIYNKLLINHLHVYNEMRRITIIFINFPANIISQQDGKGVEERINKIMLICQKCTYSYEGTINKLIIDDKGISILIFMGFPPLFHEDDAFRSVLLSLKVCKMSKQMGFKVGVGICTGKVWCGLLGNKLRNEYTSIGNIVNISCRLMLQSYEVHNMLRKVNFETNNEGYNILLDRNTYNECSNIIELVELERVKLKGKEDKLQVYTPTGKLKFYNPDEFEKEIENEVENIIINEVYKYLNIHNVLDDLTQGQLDSVDGNVIMLNSNIVENNELIYKYINNLLNNSSYKILNINYHSKLFKNNIYDNVINDIISFSNSSGKGIEEVLRELTSPKFHWYIDVLNNSNYSDAISKMLKRSSSGSSNNNIIKVLTKSTEKQTNEKVRGSGVDFDDQKIKLLCEIEKKENYINYIYSLIKGINLQHNIIFIINTCKSHNNVKTRSNLGSSTDIDKVVDDTLLNKLIKYCGKRLNSDKKFILIIINNSNLFNSNHQHPTNMVMNVNNLKKSDIKNVLLNISSYINHDLNSPNQVDNVDVVDEMVEIIYNITNGIYYYTYKLIAYLINNNFNHHVIHNMIYHFFHTITGKSDEQEDEDLQLHDIIRVIYNNYKYKLDVIDSDTLFILKILTILNKPVHFKPFSNLVTKDREVVITSNDEEDSNFRSLKSVKEEELNQILNELEYYHFITTNLTKISEDDEDLEILVNNKILKGIILNNIIPEEKLFIINNYLHHL